MKMHMYVVGCGYSLFPLKAITMICLVVLLVMILLIVLHFSFLLVAWHVQSWQLVFVYKSLLDMLLTTIAHTYVCTFSKIQQV